MLGDNGRLDKFTRQARDRCIRDVIEPMARDGLRTISVAYRDFVLGKAEANQVQPFLLLTLNCYCEIV